MEICCHTIFLFSDRYTWPFMLMNSLLHVCETCEYKKVLLFVNLNYYTGNILKHLFRPHFHVTNSMMSTPCLAFSLN
ncbi:hypothetical protein QVD17_10773 [Tagetes erecta]|uniref:Uncharacterized protein n=1 Tax=Tagetes erecta TaxID=13708 RepID=A0AAD8LA15_TARER|nr:hypothetical protein QVD17_10773 [Tagetes erecta]